MHPAAVTPSPARSASSSPSLSEAAASVVLEGRGLTKVYRMGEVEVHALRGVDLALAEGEFTVLVGASCSGKSTRLLILGGLDALSGGQLLPRGRLLTRASRR